LTLRLRGSSALSYGRAYTLNVSRAYIVGSIMVSIEGISTRHTAKVRLALAIALACVTATRAGLACVSGINLYNPNAALACNVPDFCYQRGEWPAELNQPLPFGYADSAKDVFQVFHSNHAGIYKDSFPYNLICNIPQEPLNRSMLSAGQPFQHAALSACFVPCLQRTAFLEVAPADLFDSSAFENFSGVCSGDSIDAATGTERFRSGCLWNVLLCHQTEIPFTSTLNQGCGTRNSPTAVKVLPMVVTENQPNLDSALHGRKPSASFRNLERERSGIKANARAGFPAMRFLWFRLSVVCFGNDGSGRTYEIGRQAGQFTHISVGQVMQGDRVLNTLPARYFGSLVESNNISRARFIKRGDVLAINGKFDLERDGGFHSGIIPENVIYDNLPPLLLPSINEGVSVATEF